MECWTLILGILVTIIGLSLALIGQHAAALGGSKLTGTTALVQQFPSTQAAASAVPFTLMSPSSLPPGFATSGVRISKGPKVIIATIGFQGPTGGLIELDESNAPIEPPSGMATQESVSSVAAVAVSLHNTVGEPVDSVAWAVNGVHLLLTENNTDVASLVALADSIK